MPPLCAICGKRRPRRFCPGIQADICPLCCGLERESTISCPLECVYLQESRKHDHVQRLDPRHLPSPDIEVSEDSLRRNEPLLMLVGMALGRSALSGDIPAVDHDVRDALDGLIRTLRTLESGLVYDSRPVNPVAARIYSGVQDAVADLRKRAAEHGHSIRDADLLGVMVFLQRMEVQHNNGRPKSRGFIDFLWQFFPLPQAASSSSLIVQS